MITWDSILYVAAVLADKALPPPFDAAATLAIELVRMYESRGCPVDGCPADVREDLARTPIPDGEDILSERTKAVARAKGLG